MSLGVFPLTSAFYPRRWPRRRNVTLASALSKKIPRVFEFVRGVRVRSDDFSRAVMATALLDRSHSDVVGGRGHGRPATGDSIP
jgi:hypothetical protein